MQIVFTLILVKPFAINLSCSHSRSSTLKRDVGERDAVDTDTLNSAAKFAKYAIAAYGQFGLSNKDETMYASKLRPRHMFPHPLKLFAFLQLLNFCGTKTCQCIADLV